MKHLIIVGAQRSGSTYLYHVLNNHPQVVMAQPVRPEPKFFLNDQLVARGKTYYERTYFRAWGEETRYFGEKSTSYIESVEAAQRIHHFYPDVRILMILRDSVMRAYSNYRFSVANQLEQLTFKEALEAEPERIKKAKFSTSVNPYAYRTRGHYIDYVEAYLNIFNASQLEILIFEEFVGKLASVQALYRWLGIEDSFVPESLGQVFNPTVIEKEEHNEVFKDLALGYQDSIGRLEGYLGRRIDVWRDHHGGIMR